ncbi:Hypothetical predicted protein [Xyrichtys novacula]|uniref:Uncharacterized protein n=1 Tax=Xyrichtys novacula TaxID=13765 RepID=A0AAV1FIS2_XYRNO|nr:Hypothetical predicted protein [Xyrichtys novacula]
MSSSTSRMEQNRTEEATNYDFQGFDSEEELNPLPSGVGQDSEDLDEQDQIGSPDSVNKSSPEETKKSCMRGFISRMKAISVQTFAQESILNVRSRVRRRLAHRQGQEAVSSDTSMLLESEDSLSNEIITTEDQHTNSESEEVWPSTALCKSDCERRLDEAQKCHIEKVAELEREKEEIQAIKENLFSQVSRLQDESITNERNRSLLTEKVASPETRLDEKEREIDDLKERNWRQEKHYGEKVLHLTTALEQAQDRERTLNQHSEETISKLREELKAKQEEEILAPSERHLNSTGVQTDEISPEPQQLETPAAEAQSESLWMHSLRGALSVGKFIGVSAAYALVAVGILSIGLSAHCDCPGRPF